MPHAHDLEYNLIHRFNVGDALRRSAARNPHQLAIHFQGRELSYAELDSLANQLARLLSINGIGRGDSVAIFAANSPEYVAALQAGKIDEVLFFSARSAANYERLVLQSELDAWHQPVLCAAQSNAILDSLSRLPWKHKRLG